MKEAFEIKAICKQIEGFDNLKHFSLKGLEIYVSFLNGLFFFIYVYKIQKLSCKSILILISKIQFINHQLNDKKDINMTVFSISILQLAFLTRQYKKKILKINFRLGIFFVSIRNLKCQHFYPVLIISNYHFEYLHAHTNSICYFISKSQVESLVIDTGIQNIISNL